MYGKETICLYPGLAQSGGSENFFLIFLQDRKSTSLLTVIKTLAQIPRKKKKAVVCLTMDISSDCARGKRKGEEPLFFFFYGVPQLEHSIRPSPWSYCFFPLLLCNLQAVKWSFQHGGGGIHGPGIQTGGSSSHF